MNKSDVELYEKFCFYGQAALDARNKCIGLLPEIYKRRIYLARGFNSIHEFAAKIAGLSHEQVNRVLNLEKRLVDKPALHAALVKGEVSMNKLRKVVTVATVENQEVILESVKNLSVRAVETFVRDQKMIETGHVTTQKTMFQEELQIADDVRNELMAMQKKGIDVNELLKKFLENYQQEFLKEKLTIAENLPDVASRYIPVSVKNILQKEFGDQCSVPGCEREFAEIHHLLPYAIAKKHNPRFMVQLCEEHHQITHAVNASVREFRKLKL